MVFKSILFFTLLLSYFTGYAQTEEDDRFCRSVDSLIASKTIIDSHVFKHQTPYEEAVYEDKFFFTPSKSTLLKAIYNFNFGGGDYLEFYYRKDSIVMIRARNNFNGRLFEGSFYFRSDSLIAHRGGEIEPGKIVFDIQALLSTGNKYLQDSKIILDSLKNHYQSQ